MVGLLILAAARPLLNGFDASFVPQYRALGAKYTVDGKTVDALDALSQAGSKLLRLRVWVNPKDGYCSVERTLEMAKEAKRLGMRTLIDFHYADSWADPQQQPTPAAWKDYNLEQLCEAVRVHTKDTLDRLAAQGTPADAVQIGNEIRNGMLWPLGRRTAAGFDNLSKLLNAGVQGARQSRGGPKLEVMVHHDQGGNFKDCSLFFGILRAKGVKFDWIGLSYYPWWHGTLEQLQENMDGLAREFKLPVMIVETGYPFSLKWKDLSHNFVGSAEQLAPGFPATPAGQELFIRELNKRVRAVPDNLGLGVVYWAPEYVAHPGMETPWENLCLFDFAHRLLPAATALGRG